MRTLDGRFRDPKEKVHPTGKYTKRATHGSQRRLGRFRATSSPSAASHTLLGISCAPRRIFIGLALNSFFRARKTSLHARSSEPLEAPSAFRLCSACGLCVFVFLGKREFLIAVSWCFLLLPFISFFFLLPLLELVCVVVLRFYRAVMICGGSDVLRGWQLASTTAVVFASLVSGRCCAPDIRVLFTAF